MTAPYFEMRSFNAVCATVSGRVRCASAWLVRAKECSAGTAVSSSGPERPDKKMSVLLRITVSCGDVGVPEGRRDTGSGFGNTVRIRDTGISLRSTLAIKVLPALRKRPRGASMWANWAALHGGRGA